MIKLWLLLLFSTIGMTQEIYINQVKLSDYEVKQLQQLYGYSIQPGRYWYDAFSGLWGFEGGPTQGHAIPNISFRASLPDNISGKGSNIYINGREIHKLEKQYLESIYGIGNVKSGHYWLNHLGYGGYVGGPSFFKLPKLNKQYKSPFSTRDLVGGTVVGKGYIGTDGSSASW